MVGHKRRDGSLLCPEESLPSPPPSPTPSTRFLTGGPFRPAAIPDIDVPDDLPFHRPNPYWVDPHRVSQSSSSDIFEQEGSVVSTVLADDASSIKTFDGDDETTDDENDSIIDSALNTSLPLASIFSTPKEDIADIRKVADATGLYMGLIRRPGARHDGKSSIDKFGKREDSWWVVMGKNAEAVRYLINVQKRGMPGFYQPEKEVDDTKTPESRMLGFLQVILAGAMGGAAVAFGMARML